MEKLEKWREKLQGVEETIDLVLVAAEGVEMRIHSPLFISQFSHEC